MPPAPSSLPAATRSLSSPVLVGRHRELRRLLDLALHPPAVALVEGPAGVGKTRLVAELAAHPELAGTRVVVGRCHPHREPFPLGPVVDAVRSLADLPPPPTFSPIVGALRPLLPELADRLPAQPQASGDPGIDQHVAYRAMAELLSRIGPTLCVLEDLHWCDEATPEFLRFLVDDLPASLVLILTYRREGVESSPSPLGQVFRLPSEVATARIDVAPLRPPDVRRQVGAILGVDDIDEDLAVAIHDRTGGLPFAVEELVRLALDSGVILDSGGADPVRALDALGVPGTVRDSVLGRLAALGPEAKAVVDTAAVLGLPASEALLARVSGLPAARATTAVCQALDTAVLVESGKALYGFRHLLAAQSVYQAIPTPQRRRLHLRVANELEKLDPRPLARLAHHFREAGRPRRWLECAEAAANVAGARDDPAAVRLLSDALGAPELSPPTRARLSVKLGHAALYAGVRAQHEALGVLRRVVDDEALPKGSRGTVRLLLGELLAWAGEAASSYDELVRCVPELDPQSGVAVHLLADLAAAPHLQVPVADRLAWLERAKAVSAELGDPLAELEVRATRACVLLSVGDPRAWAAAMELPSEADSAVERGRLAWSWQRVASACIYLGYDRRAQSFLDRAARAEDLVGPRLTSVLQSKRLMLRWLDGEWQGLEAAARSHARAMTAMTGAWVEPRQVVGLLALAGGDLDQAEQCFSEVADRAGPAGLARSLAVSSAGLARIRLAQGDPDAARQAATGALEAVTASGAWVWAAEVVATAVEAEIGCGQRWEAGEIVRRLAAGLRRTDAPLARAALGLCRGLVAEAAGEPELAAAAFARAGRRFAALPRPYEAAHAAARRGRCLAAAGLPGAAQAMTDAHATFSRLGASADAEENLRRLQEHGIRPTPANGAPGRPAYGEQLSPREEQVAQLAARGLTNADIATLLLISTRTVEGHVAAAVRKLGLPSKRALIRGGQREKWD